MDLRIPPILHPLLQDYTALATQEMPGRITAFYLEGSLALDGFNPRLSDIDFIAVLNSPASTGDFETILKIHQRLAKQYPQWKLSGMYFQQSDLGCLDDQVQPFSNYHDGKLKWSEQFGLSAVTWWILKNAGITLFGPPIHSLPLTVDVDHLIQTQRENLNLYWASYTTRLDGILALLTDWGVQWTVLGVLRQFFTIREHRIISKVKAGEYALTCLPERWHPIIREAIALRQDPQQSNFGSRLQRASEAFRFLRYVIQSCNDDLNAGSQKHKAM